MSPHWQMDSLPLIHQGSFKEVNSKKIYLVLFFFYYHMLLSSPYLYKYYHLASKVTTYMWSESLSVMSNSATPWNTACQTSLSMWFSRQENWSGLPFLLERIFPSRRSNPSLLHCRQFLYRLSWQGSPIYSIDIFIVLNMNILLVRIVSNAKVQ